MIEERINKYTAEKRFHEWMDGLPENTRLKQSGEWETDFRLSVGGGREILKNQTVFIGCENNE